MKILASNPDTIGDMVLREPLYQALLQGGHELMLIVRPSVAPLVRYIAPNAKVLLLPMEVYRDDLPEHWSTFAELFAAARAFAPDLLLVAPFQWTQFEEKLADELKDCPGLRRAGMTGQLYAGDPYAGYAPPSHLTFDIRVAVGEDLTEVEKNAALAAAVCGHLLDRVTPRLTADPVVLEDARRVLMKLGLEPGHFWIACVSGTVNVPIKTWPTAQWAEVLSQWVKRHDRRFLIVGLPDEKPLAEQVRQGMGALGDHASIWMEGGSLDELIALTALSAGYVGHDTGPMHLAAALQKPVLALFGGGHKLRFLPRATPSVSLTVGVACAGCGWVCAFETSHCVKAIPLEAVSRAVEDLEAGLVQGSEARVLEPSSALQAQMVREAAVLMRHQVRRTATLTQGLKQSSSDGLGQRGAEIGQTGREAALLRVELAGRDNAIAELNYQMRRINEEAVGLSRQLQDREAAVIQLRADLEAAQRDATGSIAQARTRAAQLQVLREQAREMERQIHFYIGAPARRPRRSARQWLVEWIIGTREYIPRRAPTPLPRITLAVMVSAGAASGQAAGRTLQSALRQHYPRVDLVLAGPADQDLSELTAGLDEGIVRIVSAGQSAFASLTHALATSEADVIGWVQAGDVLEPGALRTIGEFFRTHRGARGAYFEETMQVNGWHVPRPMPPTPDVYQLLKTPFTNGSGFFFRLSEYALLGGLKPEKGIAGGWDLLLRFARRYGIRVARGHVLCRSGQEAREQSLSARDDSSAMQLARSEFEATFGLAGRIRCGLIHLGNQLASRCRSAFRPDRFDFAVDTAAYASLAVENRDEQNAPPPITPLTGRAPDRLLFCAPSAGGGSLSRPRYVFYDSASDVAMICPPLDAIEPGIAADNPQGVSSFNIASNRDLSPYRGYRGGASWERALLQLPSPYWRVVPPPQGNPTADRVLDLLSPFVSTRDARMRVLNVCCGQGELLDQLQSRTRWRLFGTEADPHASAVASRKGHSIWAVAPHDAATGIPVGQQFDAIICSHLLGHDADPLTLLRRLRQLLVPGGWVVFDAPNLDGKPAEWFGPTWAGWHIPRQRALMGRRGTRAMAALADLRVVRLRTRTDPYPLALSAALNEMGLSATVTPGAVLSDSASRLGAQAAGWARLLWDWRGRGDRMYVLLKAQ